MGDENTELLFYVVHTIEYEVDCYTAMPVTWVSSNKKKLLHPPDDFKVGGKSPISWGLRTFKRLSTPLTVAEGWKEYDIEEILNAEKPVVFSRASKCASEARHGIIDCMRHLVSDVEEKQPTKRAVKARKIYDPSDVHSTRRRESVPATQTEPINTDSISANDLLQNGGGISGYSQQPYDTTPAPSGYSYEPSLTDGNGAHRPSEVHRSEASVHSAAMYNSNSSFRSEACPVNNIGSFEGPLMADLPNTVPCLSAEQTNEASGVAIAISNAITSFNNNEGLLVEPSVLDLPSCATSLPNLAQHGEAVDNAVVNSSSTTSHGTEAAGYMSEETRGRCTSASSWTNESVSDRYTSGSSHQNLIDLDNSRYLSRRIHSMEDNSENIISTILDAKSELHREICLVKNLISALAKTLDDFLMKDLPERVGQQADFHKKRVYDNFTQNLPFNSREMIKSADDVLGATDLQLKISLACHLFNTFKSAREENSFINLSYQMIVADELSNNSQWRENPRKNDGRAGIASLPNILTVLGSAVNLFNASRNIENMKIRMLFQQIRAKRKARAAIYRKKHNLPGNLHPPSVNSDSNSSDDAADRDLCSVVDKAVVDLDLAVKNFKMPSQV